MTNCTPTAQTLNYLKEHDLLDYEKLAQKSTEAVARSRELSASIRTAEKRLAEIAVLKKHIINYSNTREVYVAYRKAGYSPKYLAEPESEILLHKAAKKAFDEQGVTKLPTVKSLQQEYAALLSEKKAAYAEYHTAREEMREMMIHKSNVDNILGNRKTREGSLER